MKQVCPASHLLFNMGIRGIDRRDISAPARHQHVVARKVERQIAAFGAGQPKQVTASENESSVPGDWCFTSQENGWRIGDDR